MWIFASPNRMSHVHFFKNSKNELDYAFSKDDYVNVFSKQFHEKFFTLMSKESSEIKKSAVAFEKEQRGLLEEIKPKISTYEYKFP